MNAIDLSMRKEFIALEDISGNQEDMNYVVFNYNKTESDRLQEFVNCMKKKYSHTFTEKELQWISECDNPMQGGEFIRRVRSILGITRA